MPSPRNSHSTDRDLPRRYYWVALACLLLAGWAIRAIHLSAPLFEGAAGKQTHAAMVARNIHRGDSGLLRPIIDDIGLPGYFVKELPLYQGLTAALYHLAGKVDERLGRALSIGCWLLSTLTLTRLMRRAHTRRLALLVAFWHLAAPMGVAYSRAFMNDAAMLAASVVALAAFSTWRERPAGSTAACAAGAVALALLLKLHSAFWLAPSILYLWLQDPHAASGRRSHHGHEQLRMIALLVASISIAGAWYAHAATVHRRYPVPGATVPQGWVELGLLLDPQLYAILFRQIWNMVFTPAGALIGAAGLLARTLHWTAEEKALLVWGAGVCAQSLILGTRMFDQVARGTEYYQLPLVPVAALLIGRGLDALWQLASRRSVLLANASLGACLALLAGGAFSPAVEAMTIPGGYRDLLADCAVIRRRTRPDERFVVFADRGGTVLYYCDRRGFTFTPATRPTTLGGDSTSGGAPSVPRSLTVVRGDELNRALREATYVFLPFPELLDDIPQIALFLAREWQQIEVPGHRFLLYSRSGRTSVE